MVCIFENGRILYDESLLTEKDRGNYSTLDKLPDIEPIEGKVGVITGCNLQTKTVKIDYFDKPKEQSEIMEQILLEQQEIKITQQSQDAVLAEILLSQQNV